jgi:phage shock protein A
MAERTMTDLYEARIEDLQRLHKEVMQAHTLRLEDLSRRLIEREKELKAQMDGVLGALSSVTEQRDNADKALAEVKGQFENLRRESEMRFMDMQRALHDAEQKLSEAQAKKK